MVFAYRVDIMFNYVHVSISSCDSCYIMNVMFMNYVDCKKNYNLITIFLTCHLVIELSIVFITEKTCLYVCM